MLLTKVEKALSNTALALQNQFFAVDTKSCERCCEYFFALATAIDVSVVVEIDAEVD